MKIQNHSLHSVSSIGHLHFNHKTRGGVKKRHRTHFTSHQVEKLEEIFTNTTNPHRELIVQLSTHLNLTDKNISIWFKNRRAKIKRQSEEMGRIKTPGNGEGPRRKTLTTNSLDHQLSVPQQPVLFNPRNRYPSNQHHQTTYDNQNLYSRHELPPLLYHHNERKPDKPKIFKDEGRAISQNSNEFISSHQNTSLDIQDSNDNFYGELSKSSTRDYNVNYQEQTSGYSDGFMNSYYYPVNYGNLLNSSPPPYLSPSSEVVNVYSGSCFHDFPSLQTVVSNLSY